MIASPRALTWTTVATGSISNKEGNYGLPEGGWERDPLVATAASADLFAALIWTDRYTVKLVPTVANATVVDISIPVPISYWHDRAHYPAAIAVDARYVRVIVLADKGLAIATIDRSTAKVTQVVDLRVPERTQITYLARDASAGWIIGGHSKRDAFVWSLAVDATELPPPTPLWGAGSGGTPIVGDSDRDGSALLVAERSGATGREYLAAVRHDGAWVELAAPFPTTPTPGVVHLDKEWPAFAHAGSKWFIERFADETPPHVYAIDPAGATELLDTTWSRTGRTNLHVVSLDHDTVVIHGGTVVEPRTPFDNSRRYLDGAIYDLATGSVRAYPAPNRDPVDGATWNPALVAAIGGRLCLLGGNASKKTEYGSPEVRGAACLDRDTLAWDWFASTAMPPFGCQTVGAVETSALVLCRELHISDGHGTDGAMPKIYAHDWTLSLVRRP